MAWEYGGAGAALCWMEDKEREKGSGRKREGEWAVVVGAGSEQGWVGVGVLFTPFRKQQ